MGIIRFFFTIIHFIVIVLLFGTILNAYIPPRILGILNLLSLGFPILMIINVLLLIFWIFNWKKRATVFLLLSLFFILPTRRWINFTPSKKDKPNLKLITFNTKYGQLGDDRIYEYLNNQNADVVFFQEYENKKALNGFKYFFNNKQIVKIQSKFPIIESGEVNTDVKTGICIYADVKINGKIIRFVNVYMEPFYLDKIMVKPSSDLEENEIKAKTVLHKLIPTFKKHQIQITQIKEFINNSPYPVIVAGDFNAVPNSYEYYKISKNLNDDFLKVGKGSGTSFHDFKIPLKIDHIFSSKSIKPISYRVDRSVNISDHFPVLAEFLVD